MEEECDSLVSSKYMRTMVFEKIPDPPPPGLRAKIRDTSLTTGTTSNGQS